MKSIPIIIFGSLNCPACLKQLSSIPPEMIKKLNIKYYNLDKLKPPSQIISTDGSYSMPTWFFPKNGSKGVIIQGQMELSQIIKNRNNSFGLYEPNRVEYYNKQFRKIEKPFQSKNTTNNTSFLNVGMTFENQIKQKWGHDGTNSGTLGRELGPGNFNKIFSGTYYHNPRMAHPSDPYGSAIALNEKCNYNKFKEPAMFDDSKDLNISRNGFGKCGIYSSPAYKNKKVIHEINIQEKKYINQAPEYKRLKKNINEGSVISLTHGKIIIS